MSYQRGSRKKHKKSQSERRESQRREDERPHCVVCFTTDGLMVGCGCTAEDMRLYCFPCLVQTIRTNYDYPCHWCPNPPIHYGNNDPRITRHWCGFRFSDFMRYMWRITLNDMFYMYQMIVLIVIAVSSLFLGFYSCTTGLGHIELIEPYFRGTDPILIVFYVVCIAVIVLAHLYLVSSNVAHHYDRYAQWHRRWHPWWTVTFHRYAANGRLQVTSSYDVCSDRWAANNNQHDIHFREEDRSWLNDTRLINPNV